MMPRTAPPIRNRRRAASETDTVLTVYGELDHLTVGELCRRIETAAHALPHLTVDLAGAPFYDRAAVDDLARTAGRLRRTGHHVTFIHAPAELLGRAGLRRRARTRLERARSPRTRPLTKTAP
jgi:anti-anti-sigma regulatory factor